MKMVLWLAFVILVVSCKKQTQRVPEIVPQSKQGVGTDPVSPDPDAGGSTQSPAPPKGGGTDGAVITSVCTYPEVIPPSSYTWTDVALMPVGFGIFSDVNYDKGWKQGYQDAVFYHNYYKISDANNNVCGTLTMKEQIYDMTTGQYTWHTVDYTQKPNELLAGVGIFWGDCRSDWMLKRCVLLNSLESKSLRLQYEFNNNYTGFRTDEEKQFDRGRYEGFMSGISNEPLTTP
jgi:hypothetical protein